MLYVLEVLCSLNQTRALQMRPAQAVKEWQLPQPGLMEQIIETQLTQRSPVQAEPTVQGAATLSPELAPEECKVLALAWDLPTFTLLAEFRQTMILLKVQQRLMTQFELRTYS